LEAFPAEPGDFLLVITFKFRIVAARTACNHGPSVKTVQEIITATAGYLGKHKVESPRLNAELLLAHVLGKKRIDLYLEFDRPLGDRELDPLRGLMKRRAAGEPLQHLLGTVEFHGRIFLCDARALIPRPETEHLVELLLALPSKPSPVLDVGAGGGVIGLTLAAEWPDAAVDAVDISPDALALAAENAARLGLTDRVRFFQSDLFSAVPGRYALIVANLPYIPAGEIPALSREVRRDPLSALDGGPDGAVIIRAFLDEAREHLLPGGAVALEIGAGQSEMLVEHLRLLGYTDCRVRADYAGDNRFLFANHG
jgi:release factor glutamine methyltransferase